MSFLNLLLLLIAKVVNLFEIAALPAGKIRERLEIPVKNMDYFSVSGYIVGNLLVILNKLAVNL